MACCGDQSGSRRGTTDVDDEIEEGEFVSGYGYGRGSDTDTDDEDARYFLQPYPHYDAEDRPGVKQSHLEDIVAGVQRRDELPSSPPASSPGSNGTISDGNVDAGGARAVLYPCPVCPREFGSKKAVHGHMRVHAQGKEKERPVAVVVSGGSVKEEVVVAEPRLSMPVARTNQVVHGSSSAEPSHSASMAIVVAAAAPNPINESAVVPTPPAAPQQAAVPPPPAALQQAAVPPPPAAPQHAAVQPPAAAPQHAAVQPPQQDVVHLPAAPQQAVVHPPAPPQQLVVPLPAPPHQLVVPVLAAPQHVVLRPPDEPLHIIADHNNEGFTCRECSRCFPTHQGLGGHVAGHKNRRAMREAAAAAASGFVGEAGPIACRGGTKPKKVHVCSQCDQVYLRGVSLGGHMRKHYKGTPIMPKKRRLGPAPAASVVEAPDQLMLTLSVQAAQAPPLAPPAIEAAQPALAPAALEPAEPAPVPPAAEVAPQPAQAPPPVASSVRIFGVTIVQPQEESSDEH